MIKKQDFISSKEAADKWQISDRMVRKYCKDNRISGAILIGKTWYIPLDAIKPTRLNPLNNKNSFLLETLKREKKYKIHNGIYHKIQIEFAYNSNHIEGSTLSHAQTRYIFDTNIIQIGNEKINIDDIIETNNHFKCFDYIIDNVSKPLSEQFIKKLHQILKNSTSQSRNDFFNIGKYKKFPNEVGGKETTSPEKVKDEIRKLLGNYNKINKKTFYDLIAFHKKFESIHPFQDGNGRVGRLILFKECLANNIVPFIIDEEHKLFYYRGLKLYDDERGYLLDTCLSCQDKFKIWLDYFKIKY